ncbi:MAG TPA: hypothetical protein VNN81_00790 [Bradyrhizobium sp.]|jgi:hypothetical protein|nr:hypothetical protein [Bradyrhizobium sp.]
MRPAVRGGAGAASDSSADFFRREPFVSFGVRAGSDVNQGGFLVTLVGRLSVVTAYVAIAFVGAIVLGVF